MSHCRRIDSQSHCDYDRNNVSANLVPRLFHLTAPAPEGGGREMKEPGNEVASVPTRLDNKCHVFSNGAVGATQNNMGCTRAVTQRADAIHTSFTSLSRVYQFRGHDMYFLRSNSKIPCRKLVEIYKIYRSMLHQINKGKKKLDHDVYITQINIREIYDAVSNIFLKTTYDRPQNLINNIALCFIRSTRGRRNLIMRSITQTDFSVGYQ